jgi:hypothetical protein
MINYKSKYPNLDNFFTYFFWTTDTHQAKSVSEVLVIYFSETETARLSDTLSEMNLLIDENLTEDELTKAIGLLGCDICIDNDDWQPSKHTYKEWILDLRDILQNEVNRWEKAE